MKEPNEVQDGGDGRLITGVGGGRPRPMATSPKKKRGGKPAWLLANKTQKMGTLLKTALRVLKGGNQKTRE